jgi:dTDP-4-dehydrorhamnose reductase
VSTTAVVGVSGPLGTLLSDFFLLSGRAVRGMSRSAAGPADRVDVLRDDAGAALAGVDEVVYCAWNTADRTPASQQLHVEAARRWATASARAGLPFIFTSTVLAGAASSSYGHHKLLAEEAVAAAGGTSMRIGLVTDDAYPFLATRLRAACRSAPGLAAAFDVPVFAVGSPTVAEAVAAELAAPRAGGVVWLAPTQGCSLRDVATWGSSRSRPATSTGGRGGLLRIAAALPVHRGFVGRYVDALSGLTATPAPTPGVLEPLSGAVDPQGWQQPLRRT